MQKKRVASSATLFYSILLHPILLFPALTPLSTPPFPSLFEQPSFAGLKQGSGGSTSACLLVRHDVEDEVIGLGHAIVPYAGEVVDGTVDVLLHDALRSVCIRVLHSQRSR